MLTRFLAPWFSSALLLLLLLLPSARFCHAAEAVPAILPKAEIIRLGERMYRAGILPSGKVMSAYIRGDVEVDSTAFSCSSCHMRAGIGSVEGGVVTPPTNGAKLYKPYQRPPSLGDRADKAGRYIYAKTIPQRPAYTRESLAIAMRFGIDPSGQTFNDVMPRYPLSDGDMALLIDYLSILSTDYSPGVTDTSYAFATIITDDVTAVDRQAMLAPLEKFIAAMNSQVKLYKDFIKFGYPPSGDMQYAFRQASLAVWELKGPPETWSAQLRAYNANEPVFAVLGGISNGDWRPIHDFCEAERLPCLYPITNFPVISDTDWYTFYFNKGYFQEGEQTALYLNSREAVPAEANIVQVVQDSPAGKALAAGFDKGWSELGRTPVKSVVLTKRELLDQKSLAKLLAKLKPGILLFWADAELIPALPALVSGLAAPAQLFLSSTFLGKQTTTIAETVRQSVFLTFPYRLTPFVGPKNSSYGANVPILTTAGKIGENRITTKIQSILHQSVQQGLRQLYDNLFRDHLLDVMSMQMDQVVLDYERLSFGPGQRYASKGCYIMQLGMGLEPELLPRSDWVMH